MRVKQAGIFLGLGLSAWAGALTAQTPGQVGDTLKPPPALKPLPPPAQVQGPRKPAFAPAQGGQAIPVRKFEFYGNTLIDPAELQAQVANFIGKNLTLFQIYEIADRLTSLYVARGYTLATVNVPAQRIDQGIVRLEVIEGRVGEIVFDGARGFDPRSIENYLPDVVPGYPYRGAALAEGLARLNELPGLTTRAVLRPGEVYGTSDVVIRTEEDRFVGATGVDNYGREDLGEFRFSANGSFNSPLGHEDQLQVLGLVSEDALLKYGFIAYSVPASYRGTRITLSYGEAQFEVDSRTDSDVEGENKSGRIKVSHPFLRTGTDRLTLGLGLSQTSGDSDQNGIPISGGTDLTLVEFDTEYQHAWSTGAASQATLGLSSNFDQADFRELHPEFFFGGDPSQKPRDDQRFRAELDLLHLQPLPKRLEALIRLAGAWSPDPLPDTQKFSLGGPGSVRGYPASEVRGDRGTLASLTVRRPFMLGPVSMYGSAFADSGQVSTDDPFPGEAAQSLSSVGLGLEARYKGWLAKLDWAFPRDNHEASDGRDDSRLFGTLSVAF